MHKPVQKNTQTSSHIYIVSCLDPGPCQKNQRSGHETIKLVTNSAITRSRRGYNPGEASLIGGLEAKPRCSMWAGATLYHTLELVRTKNSETSRPMISSSRRFRACVASIFIGLLLSWWSWATPSPSVSSWHGVGRAEECQRLRNLQQSIVWCHRHTKLWGSGEVARPSIIVVACQIMVWISLVSQTQP